MIIASDRNCATSRIHRADQENVLVVESRHHAHKLHGLAQPLAARSVFTRDKIVADVSVNRTVCG